MPLRARRSKRLALVGSFSVATAIAFANSMRSLVVVFSCSARADNARTTRTSNTSRTISVQQISSGVNPSGPASSAVASPRFVAA